MVIKHKSLKTMKYFVNNLNSFMGFKNFRTIKELAEYLDCKERRVISWINFQRSPSLSTLDKIANKLNVETHRLLGENIRFTQNNNTHAVKNCSFHYFRMNLRKLLNQYDIKTANEFYEYFEHELSKSTYYSYFKKKHHKVPSLFTIEKIAGFFDIEPYELIKGGK